MHNVNIPVFTSAGIPGVQHIVFFVYKPFNPRCLQNVSIFLKHSLYIRRTGIPKDKKECETCV